MQRFVYTPRVEAFIRLENEQKTIDITEDIIQGSVVRRLNAMSEANFTLQNKNAKYLDKYKIDAMDRIIVRARRIGTPFPIFSGYIDSAPYYQLYPGPVTIKASCTLKLLQHTYFDPGVPHMIKFFQRFGWNYDPSTGGLTDPADPGDTRQNKFGDLDIRGGIGDVIHAIMTDEDLGGWPKDHVHIYDLPEDFLKSIEAINRKSNEEFKEILEEQRDYLRKLLRGKTTPGGGTNKDDDVSPVTGNVAPVKVARMIVKAGFKGLNNAGENAIVTALAVAMAESSLKSDADNFNDDGSVDYGLFQINSIHKPPTMSDFVWKTRMLTPQLNVNEAYRIYQGSGDSRNFAPWVAYTNGRYKRYLDQAQDAVDRMNNSGDTDDEPADNQQTPKRDKAKKVSFMYPIAPYSGFNHNVTPQGYFGNNRGDHLHAGIDIAANRGADLVACVDGKVSVNEQGGVGAGKYVVLKKKNSNYTFNYFHMDSISVREGQQVIQGQKLGTVGSTGTSSGFNHLHFEAHPRGGFGYSGAVDPDQFCAPAWKSGNKVADMDDPSDTGGGPSGDVDITDPFAIAMQSYFFTLQLQGGDELSHQLTGKRAIANDIPLLQWIQTAVTASGRVFTSLPNGDFLAFYPDRFGYFGRTAYFRLSDIEIIDLNINKNDDELTTHVFASGSWFINEHSWQNKAASMVASVEEAAFDYFVNVNPKKKEGEGPRKDAKFDVNGFLRRFGARPMPKEIPEIRHPILLWLYAWMVFTEQWAKQFSATGSFTFMPELFPGGIVAFGDRITMFIEEVTHTFDMTGGFSTTANLSAPAALDDSFDWMPIFQEGDLETVHDQPRQAPGEFRTPGMGEGGDNILLEEEKPRRTEEGGSFGGAGIGGGAGSGGGAAPGGGGPGA